MIVPLSTIGNWQREFELWSDMNVVVYHGAMPSRNMIQQFDMYHKDEKVCEMFFSQSQLKTLFTLAKNIHVHKRANAFVCFSI